MYKFFMYQFNHLVANFVNKLTYLLTYLHGWILVILVKYIKISAHNTNTQKITLAS